MSAKDGTHYYNENHARIGEPYHMRGQSRSLADVLYRMVDDGRRKEIQEYSSGK